MNVMRMIKKPLLALCLGLAFALTSGHAEVSGDTTSLQGAIYLATNNVYPKKTILLVVSNTNGCSACLALASTGLPSTNPPVLQFLRESFVYWPCGPNENCTAYTQWLGTGTFPVPQLLMLDPTNTSTYFSVTVGFGGASGLYNLMRLGLLQGTAPYVARLEEKNNSSNGLDITAGNYKNINTIPFSNIVVKCRSISTNVQLYYVKYKLDTTNGWSSLTISNQTAWDLSLNPAQIVSGTNVLRFYAKDINTKQTKTNVFTFVYNPGGVVQNPTTTALASSANSSTYGQTVTFTGTVTSAGSPVTAGTVTFKDGTATLGTGTPNSSGVATFATSSLSVAGSPHSITAVYAGSGSFAGSTSSAISQTVSKANPVVTAWPTASAIAYGQTLASSTLSGGSATPAGSFAFTTPAAVPTATGLQSVTYTPTDTANYNTANGSVNVTVIVALLGDANNNGTVELSELNTVFANYWSANTSVRLTNPAALCNGYFQFWLTNISGLNLKVQVSTNLSSWAPLTNVAPVYQFKDPGATGSPRFYRLAP